MRPNHLLRVAIVAAAAVASLSGCAPVVERHRLELRVGPNGKLVVPANAGVSSGTRTRPVA